MKKGTENRISSVRDLHGRVCLMAVKSPSFCKTDPVEALAETMDYWAKEAEAFDRELEGFVPELDLSGFDDFDLGLELETGELLSDLEQAAPGLAMLLDLNQLAGGLNREFEICFKLSR